MRPNLRPYRREIGLALAGLAATLIAFAFGATAGWRVMGGFLMFMALWILCIGQAAYLVPGWKPGYLGNKGAVVVAMVSAALGLGIVANTKDLAIVSYRACAALQVAGCELRAACINDNVLALPSATRKVRAVRFVRSCGAGPSTHVSIVPMGEALPDAPGNAFIVDGTPDLTLLWVDGKHLAIAGGAAARRQLQMTSVNGIQVSYEDGAR